MAALKLPFDVVTVFQRTGRVPVKGTINRFPFRSSLMNMGDGHMMVVNGQMRAGAQCKAGDTVKVLMEVDEEKRTVDVPGHLKKIIAIDSEGQGILVPALFHPSHRGHERPETRERRIAAMMDALRKNQRQK